MSYNICQRTPPLQFIHYTSYTIISYSFIVVHTCIFIILHIIIMPTLNFNHLQ